MLESDKLVIGCKEGNRKCQKELYTKYYRVVYSVAVRFSTPTSGAEDLIQDIFIKLYTKVHLFKGGSYEMLGGWIKRLSTNYCIDKGRRVGLLFSDSDIIAIDEVYDYSLDKKYELNDILKAVDKLSPRYKEVFSMYVLDGHTHKVISANLGINISTSKTNLYKAKLNLRKYLTDEKSKRS